MGSKKTEPHADHSSFMDKAVQKAVDGVLLNEGGPFGCVIVKNGVIVGSGNNRVTSSNDPTAHAEIVAIRQACKNLDSFQLEGCVIYTSCEPCPMCLGAIYWARPDRVYYACSKEDASESGFDDGFIYREIQLDPSKRKIIFEQLERENALRAFKAWNDKDDKIEY